MTQHSRTEQLLEQFAGGQSIADQLGRGRVALIVPDSAAIEPQAQLIATFFVNLAARLYPVVRELHVCVPPNAQLTAAVPRWTAASLSDTMGQFLVALGPPARCSVHAELPTHQYDAVVAIAGGASLPATLFAGGSGWLVQLSTEAPVPVTGPPNPVGAYATASFAVAEIWKQLLAPSAHLFLGTPIFPLKGAFEFSTFDYSHRARGPNPDLPAVVSLQRLTAVGLGAGGMAALYTLASLADLRGHASLIEPDEATLSNLNRLVAADESDAAHKRPKVDIAASLLRRHTGLTVDQYLAAFDEVRESLGRADLARVLAAVHSREARRSIQSETPHVVWDAAATATGEFFLWRVAFGQTPCLACRLTPEDRDPEREKARQLEKLLGETEATWIRKIRDNEPFTGEEVEVLDARLQETGSEARAPVIGQRFGDWDAEQCGKLKLPNPDDEVPIPFSPVLAGVLLAGEVLKDALCPDAILAGSYWNTLLGRFMPHNAPRRCRPRVDCPICSKSAFQAQYERHWGAAKTLVDCSARDTPGRHASES